MMRRAGTILILLSMTACVSPPAIVVPVAFAGPPPSDPLYHPRNVTPGRLAYAPDGDTFAPVLTEQAAYPTQRQANFAYQRAMEGLVPVHGSARDLTTLAKPNTPPVGTSALPFLVGGGRAVETPPASVRLFACQPGAIDSQTATVRRYGAAVPVVLCATDFLDPVGATLFRAPVNFYYHRRAWQIDFVNPPAQLARWLFRTPSPKDPWRWVPGRDRYQ